MIRIYNWSQSGGGDVQAEAEGGRVKQPKRVSGELTQRCLKGWNQFNKDTIGGGIGVAEGGGGGDEGGGGEGGGGKGGGGGGGEGGRRGGVQYLMM